MKTKPFPFYRYRTIFDEGPVAYLGFCAKHIESPIAKQVAKTMYPGDEDYMSLYLGGVMEFIQVYMVATKGVVLHVADTGLIDACKNSEIPETLSLKDFNLPYPYIEVRFPKTSGIEPAYLVNLHHPEYRAWVTWFEASISHQTGKDIRFKTYIEMDEGWVLATAEPREDAKEYIRSLVVDAHRPLWEQMLHSERSVASDEELETVREAIKVLLLSLLMRRENTKVRAKKCIGGLKAADAKKAEKRPQYTVTPPKLISPKQAREQYDSDPTGKHVKGHWRQAHVRVLAHERFKRNEDGTPKVLFIAPIAVKGGGRGERRL